MCGFAGIISLDGALPPRVMGDLAVAMAERLRHRGPDDKGQWLDPEGFCALAHRRLAVIDLSPQAAQPLISEDGASAVAVNGEIYNYRQLRSELEGRGHRFRSGSDSECIVHLLEDHEPREVISRLDGMFAFANWNGRRRKLILARDPFGQKPVYYAQGDGWFAFASELLPLALLPWLDRSLDHTALAEYLLLQYVPAPRTILKSVRKLPPGCFLRLDSRGHTKIENYFSFNPGGCQAPDPDGPRTPLRLPNRRWPVRKLQGLARRLPYPRHLPQSRAIAPARVEQLRRILSGAVEKRLVSDVPMGVLLSGGVDSSLVTAIMARELGRQPHTFSIGFADSAHSEHHLAARIARLLGCDHHEELLDPEVFGLIDQVVEVLDEPNGDTSCLPTLLLCRTVRKQITVALSGDGGDELFYGYPRYLALESKTPSLLGPGPAGFYLSYVGPFVMPPDELARVLGGLPDALRARLERWSAYLANQQTPLCHRLRCLEAANYLPGAVLAKVDRMSMSVALEVRSPLLDRKVAAWAEGLEVHECSQAGKGKLMLKKVAEKYLPPEFVNRPKTGFGIPSDFWQLPDLIQATRDMIVQPGSELSAHLGLKGLDLFLARLARDGRASGITQVWPLLILEKWLARLRTFPQAAHQPVGIQWA